MDYIKCPIAKTIYECIEHLDKGGELWMELSTTPEDGELSQIEDYDELMDLVDYEENVEDWKFHLVD
jgi:hypothetical protein